MKQPFFSVVMAVQNALPHLDSALGSMLDQTFGDYELIVVDDHSTDGTLETLQAVRDPRLKLLQSGAKGQTPALNEGIRAAKSDWIVRMDGDDWCDPRRLERQKLAIEGAPASVVLISSDYWICDEELTRVARVSVAAPNPKLRRYLEKKNNPFCHPTVTFHRPTAVQVGLYDERIRNAQDYHLWLRMLQGKDWAHVPEALVSYRVRRGSLSVLYQPQQSGERKAILKPNDPSDLRADRPQLRIQNTKQVEAVYHYKLGFAAWLGGPTSAALKHFARTFRDGNSLRWKALLLMILALLPRRVRLPITGYAGVYR